MSLWFLVSTGNFDPHCKKKPAIAPGSLYRFVAAQKYPIYCSMIELLTYTLPSK